MRYLNFVTKLKKMFTDPQVYAVVFKNSKGRELLYLDSGYSLEEIYGKFVEQLPVSDRNEGWSPYLWQIKGFKLLMEQFQEPEAQPTIEIKDEETDEIVAVTPDKKEMIKIILKNKDKVLLEVNKSMFSELEIKYLEDRINERS